TPSQLLVAASEGVHGASQLWYEYIRAMVGVNHLTESTGYVIEAERAPKRGRGLPLSRYLKQVRPPMKYGDVEEHDAESRAAQEAYLAELTPEERAERLALIEERERSEELDFGPLLSYSGDEFAQLDAASMERLSEAVREARSIAEAREIALAFALERGLPFRDHPRRARRASSSSKKSERRPSRTPRVAEHPDDVVLAAEFVGEQDDDSETDEFSAPLIIRATIQLTLAEQAMGTSIGLGPGRAVLQAVPVRDEGIPRRSY
ncbi:hypothetical protein JS562_53560, partial [Agrobacterium sp. S2]|nr:hypothetical protein [Agrobacterium sp. S2]